MHVRLDDALSAADVEEITREEVADATCRRVWAEQHMRDATSKLAAFRAQSTRNAAHMRALRAVSEQARASIAATESIIESLEHQERGLAPLLEAYTQELAASAIRVREAIAVEARLKEKHEVVQGKALRCMTDLVSGSSAYAPMLRSVAEAHAATEQAKRDLAVATNRIPPPCSICQEELLLPSRGVRTTPCGHSFHIDCLGAALVHAVDRACPTCRSHVPLHETELPTTHLSSEQAVVWGGARRSRGSARALDLRDSSEASEESSSSDGGEPGDSWALRRPARTRALIQMASRALEQTQALPPIQGDAESASTSANAIPFGSRGHLDPDDDARTEVSSARASPSGSAWAREIMNWAAGSEVVVESLPTVAPPDSGEQPAGPMGAPMVRRAIDEGGQDGSASQVAEGQAAEDLTADSGERDEH